MWKNIVGPGRPKTTIWCTLSEYVMLIAFSLSQWLHERATVFFIRTLPVFKSLFRFLAYTRGKHWLALSLALAFRRVLFSEPPFEGRRVDIDGGILAVDSKKFALSSVKICHVVQSAPYK